MSTAHVQSVLKHVQAQSSTLISDHTYDGPCSQDETDRLLTRLWVLIRQQRLGTARGYGGANLGHSQQFMKLQAVFGVC